MEKEKHVRRIVFFIVERFFFFLGQSLLGVQCTGGKRINCPIFQQRALWQNYQCSL